MAAKLFVLGMDIMWNPSRGDMAQLNISRPMKQINSEKFKRRTIGESGELVVTNVKHAVVNKKTAAGAALMAASVSPAFAEVDITGAINSAVSGGQANVSLVVAGLIGMAALGFGVTMVVGFLRK